MDSEIAWKKERQKELGQCVIFLWTIYGSAIQLKFTCKCSNDQDTLNVNKEVLFQDKVLKQHKSEFLVKILQQRLSWYVYWMVGL